MCNAEISTEQLYYADAETNTRHKKKDAEVSCWLSLSHTNIFLLRSKSRRILIWQRWEMVRTRATMMRTKESLRNCCNLRLNTMQSRLAVGSSLSTQGSARFLT
jgi:hypothetical protein